MSETITNHTADRQPRPSPLEHAVNRLEKTTATVDALREQLRTSRAAQREALSAVRVVNRQPPPARGALSSAWDSRECAALASARGHREGMGLPPSV